MKKLISYLTVALVCCGHSSLFGQTQDGTRAAPIRLVSALIKVSTDANLDELPSAKSASDQIPNPFDILAGQLTQEPAPESTSTPADHSQAVISEEPVPNPILVEVSEGQDPASLPVGGHPGRTSLVETMADYDTIASIQNAAIAPVDWCHGATRTPNPVAEVLMRQGCVEGLWDGYAAQRAAECADMWEKLTATKNCRGCGSSHRQCQTHDGGHNARGSRPVNRYVTQACDSYVPDSSATPVQ